MVIYRKCNNLEIKNRKEMRVNVMKFEFDMSFENIKDKIVFRIIGENKLTDYKENDAGNILYSLMGNGMYMIYVIELDDNFSMVFTDVLLEKMECSEEMVKQWAKKNTEKKYPPVLKNVENAIFETLINSENVDVSDENLLKYRSNCNLLETEHMVLTQNEGEQLHVLTNTQAKYGAGVIFYEGVLKKVGKIFDSDLFLIPSSIHEIILIPKYANITREELNFILNDVNRGFLKNDEILGEKVMIYDVSQGKIR